MTTAAAWMVAFRWSDRLLGFLSLAVLARALTPDGFGLVGYATLVLATILLWTAAGKPPGPELAIIAAARRVAPRRLGHEA